MERETECMKAPTLRITPVTLLGAVFIVYLAFTAGHLVWVLSTPMSLEAFLQGDERAAVGCDCQFSVML